MAALTAQVAPHTALNPVTMTTGLGGVTGNTAPCGSGLGLMLINGTAATCVITLHVPAATTFDGLVIANRTVTLPGHVRRRDHHPAARPHLRRPGDRAGHVRRRRGHGQRRRRLHQRVRESRSWTEWVQIIHPGTGGIAEVSRLSLQQWYAAGWRPLAARRGAAAAAGPRTGTDDQGPGRQGREGRQR